MLSATRCSSRYAKTLPLKPGFIVSCVERGRRLAKVTLTRTGVRSRHFTVLGLESSADDTCAAVVTSERKILSNVVLNQSAVLEEHGGIEPYAALHEHQKKMPLAVRRALDEANLDMTRIDGIAFTRGPGMSGCLSVCSNAAKTLAAALNKPLVGVHHMQAHALTSILTSPTSSDTPTFPFLTLLISGGHTLLILALSIKRFKILATTVDSAVGRAIDKVSRELRLDWQDRAPGAALEAFCQDGQEIMGIKDEDIPKIEPIKVALRNELKFSFSGIHSVVDRYILEHGTPNTCEVSSSTAQFPGSERERDLTKRDKDRSGYRLSDPHRLAIARAFQTGVAAQLEEKIVLALRWCIEHRQQILGDSGDSGEDLSQKGLLPVRHVVVSGGVASNMFLRQRLKDCLAKKFPDEDLSLVFPPPSLCTDNAAMIAWASMHRFLSGDSDDYTIESRAKWSIEELDVS